MKTLFQKLITTFSISVVFAACAALTVYAQDGRVQVAQLEYLSSKASTTIDVTIDEKLLQLTAKLFKKGEDDDVKELINGLKGIYVKSFEFDKEGQYGDADVESIRTQLRSPTWNRIIGINSRKDGKVDVYLMTNGSQISGLAVLATEPKELTIVNIIGPIDLEKLSKLEGQFGVPELGIEPPAKPKVKN